MSSHPVTFVVLPKIESSSPIEFGANVDADDTEEASDGAGDGWVRDAENSLSGLEHTEGGTAEAIAD